jgi:hypothetical protein
LPRRYFIFFDSLYQAGRHNKQLWKVVTELNNGDNQVPYGSCIFEAHVMTTIKENYYKWLFLLLSDVDEVRDEHLEEQFTMEYECGDEDTGELPEELIDYQESNTRLHKGLEIYFDELEHNKQQLFKVVTDEEELQDIRLKEREALEELIRTVKTDHQLLIAKLRERVRYVRGIKKADGRTSRLSYEEVKRVVSTEKKRLIQFRSEESRRDGASPPEQKKRRTINDHKSRCSDLKVKFFQQTKEMLDNEETNGLIKSWEKVYKFLMNNHLKHKTLEVEPVMKEPSKMLNELGKAVDLDEIMGEEQNLHNSWITA